MCLNVIGPMQEERYQDYREGGSKETATPVKHDGGGHNGGNEEHEAIGARPFFDAHAQQKRYKDHRGRGPKPHEDGLGSGEKSDEILHGRCTSSWGSVGSHSHHGNDLALEASGMMALEQA